MPTDNGKKILVLGAGNFGTCLAQHLATNGFDVDIWTRNEEIEQSINRKNVNPIYFKSFTLSERIKAVREVQHIAIGSYRALVLAIPTQSLRLVLKQFNFDGPVPLIISAAKGIEISSLRFPLDIIGDVFGKETQQKAVVLSGPSFAIEVINQQATAVSLGSLNEAACVEAQNIFHSPFFPVGFFRRSP